METEIPEMLRRRKAVYGERFTFHSSRTRMSRVSREDLVAMDVESKRCAAELADARVDVIGYACFLGVMSMGHGYHRRSEESLGRAAVGNFCKAPIVTSAGALVDGLKAMNARSVSLLAPYMRRLTDLVVSYIEGEGIKVVDAISFEIPNNLEVGSRDPMLLVRDVERLSVEGADAVILSACVQMQSLPAIQVVEDKLGLPVTSASACTVRAMLQALDLEPVVPGAGAALALTASA